MTRTHFHACEIQSTAQFLASYSLPIPYLKRKEVW